MGKRPKKTLISSWRQTQLNIIDILTPMSLLPEDKRSSRGVDTTQSGMAEGAKAIAADPFELPTSEPLQLRILVDKSVVEVFANSRQAG